MGLHWRALQTPPRTYVGLVVYRPNGDMYSVGISLAFLYSSVPLCAQAYVHIQCPTSNGLKYSNLFLGRHYLHYL